MENYEGAPHSRKPFSRLDHAAKANKTKPKGLLTYKRFNLEMFYFEGLLWAIEGRKGGVEYIDPANGSQWTSISPRPDPYSTNAGCVTELSNNSVIEIGGYGKEVEDFHVQYNDCRNYYKQVLQETYSRPTTQDSIQFKYVRETNVTKTGGPCANEAIYIRYH